MLHGRRKCVVWVQLFILQIKLSFLFYYVYIVNINNKNVGLRVKD